MPRSAAEIINDLFTKAGIELEDENLKKIVTNGELLKLQIPDETEAKILSNLHTLDSAKAQLKPVLKKEITAELYNGVDAELYELASEHGVDASELKNLERTSLKIKTLASKIKELSSKAKDSTGKEKQELIDQINTLKADKSELTKQHNANIEQIKKEAEQEVTNFAILSHLKGYDYVNDKAPKDVNAKLANLLLTEKIASLNGKVVYDKSLGKLKVVSQDGSALYDAKNNPVTFESLSDQTVAEGNLIKTSSGGSGNGQGGNGSGGDNRQQPVISTRPGAGDFDSQMNQLITEAGKVTSV